MKSKKQYPSWSYPSYSAWQRDMRRRTRTAMRAADVACYGSAYSPAGKELSQALELLQIAVEKHKVKNWK